MSIDVSGYDELIRMRLNGGHADLLFSVSKCLPPCPCIKASVEIIEALNADYGYYIAPIDLPNHYKLMGWPVNPTTEEPVV